MFSTFIYMYICTYYTLITYNILQKRLSSLSKIKIANKGKDDMGFNPGSIALELLLLAIVLYHIEL